jgi:hypothetical protein
MPVIPADVNRMEVQAYPGKNEILFKKTWSKKGRDIVQVVERKPQYQEGKKKKGWAEGVAQWFKCLPWHASGLEF